MRRHLLSTEAILLLTVVIWAFNVTVTKYILGEGFQPLSFAAVRYALAALAIFVVLITLFLERSLRIGGRSSLGQVGVAVLRALRQPGLLRLRARVHDGDDGVAAHRDDADLRGLFGAVAGLERMTAAVLARRGRLRRRRRSRRGLGTGGDVSGDLRGILARARHRRRRGRLLGRRCAAHAHVLAVSHQRARDRWSCRAGLVPSPRARRSPTRSFDFGWLVWLGLAFAIVGPLVLTNVLWFTAVHRVGPARASLFVNLQPFLAAVFAVILLSEPLSAWQVGGGLLIGVGLLLAGRRGAVPAPAE